MAVGIERRTNQLVRQRNIAFVSCLLLILALVLNGAWANVCRTKTIIAHNTTGLESWVDNKGNASAQYLHDRSLFIADRYYDRNPQSFQAEDELLLAEAHSDVYKDLEKQMHDQETSGRWKERDVSSTHQVESIVPHPEDMTCVIITSVATWIGDKRVGYEHLKTTIAFKDDGGVIKWYGLLEEQV